MKLTDKAKEHLIHWLRDAHAMEEQASTLLTSLHTRLENYPDFKQRVYEHIQETALQKEKIAQCLQRLGAEVSTLKDVFGKTMAMMQGFSTAIASDEIVKANMFSFAFENMEIAAYKALIAAANAVQDIETAAICEQILKEEIEMSNWLSQNTEQLVGRFLELSRCDPAQAKR